jgi:hypothetical protein
MYALSRIRNRDPSNQADAELCLRDRHDLRSSAQQALRAVRYNMSSKRKKRSCMPSAGFEPAIPIIKRIQNYAYGIGMTLEAVHNRRCVLLGIICLQNARNDHVCSQRDSNPRSQ